MDVLVIILAVVCFYGIRVSYRGHDDYMSRAQTDSIKGIFAIIILYSHMRGYLPPPEGYDKLYYKSLNFLGQLMVVMFLVYSGYGIMEAIKRNRDRYIKSFFTHRFVKVWLMFAMAVFCFLLLSFALDHSYPMENYIYCWIGWLDIGNSNWFVFDILVLYLITYIVLYTSSKKDLSLRTSVMIIYAMTLIMVVVMRKIGKAWLWYDTILAYPLGMLYSLYKNKIDFSLRSWRWIVALFVLFILFGVQRYGYMNRVLYFSGSLQVLSRVLYSSVFALIVILLTMKVKIDNKYLRWLGKQAFSIYILQRIAMIVGSHIGLNEKGLVFAAFVVPVTLLIAAIYTAMTDRINKRLFI